MRKKSLLILGLLLGFFLNSKGQTYFSEDFNTTTNWTFNNGGGTGEENSWIIDANHTCGVCGQTWAQSTSVGGSGSNILHIYSKVDLSIGGGGPAYSAGSNSVTVYADLNTDIDCSAGTGLVLEFNYLGNSPAGSNRVYYSVNSGTNWTEITPNTQFAGRGIAWQTFSQAIPALDGQANVRLRFTFDDITAGAQDPPFAIDDIRIYEPNIIPPVVASLVSSTDAACVGSLDGTATITASGGSSALTYAWYEGTPPGTLMGSLTDTFATALNPGDYYVVVSDTSATNKDTVSFTIGSGTSYSFSITDADQTICEGENVTFNYTYDAGTFDEYWSNDNTLTINGDKTATATPTTTTTYIGYIQNPTSGCQSNRDSITITIGAGPVIGMDPDTVTIQSGDEVTLDAAVDPANVTFQWTNSAGDNLGSEETYAVSPGSDTEYIVEVKSSSTGCMSADTILVIVEGGLEVYTSFTPNGDKHNDTWGIKGIDKYPDVNVQIFNRWGRTVFQQVGDYEDNEWDGTHDGNDLPAGAYYYIINLGDGTAELVGTVTILK